MCPTSGLQHFEPEAYLEFLYAAFYFGVWKSGDFLCSFAENYREFMDALITCVSRLFNIKCYRWRQLIVAPIENRERVRSQTPSFCVISPHLSRWDFGFAPKLSGTGFSRRRQTFLLLWILLTGGIQFQSLTLFWHDDQNINTQNVSCKTCYRWSRCFMQKYIPYGRCFRGWFWERE